MILLKKISSCFVDELSSFGEDRAFLEVYAWKLDGVLFSYDYCDP